MGPELQIVEQDIEPHDAGALSVDREPDRLAEEGIWNEVVPGKTAPPRPRLENSRQLTARLGLSFALLIGSMLGLGWWVSCRSVSVNARLESTIAQRTGKLRAASEALRYSSENSRITMQVFVQGSATPELLDRRSQNSEKISELVRELEQQCDSQEEKRLLLAVKQARAPYVNSYKRALTLLLEEKNSDMAEQVMLHETGLALYSYHAAWHEFVRFELEQVEKAAVQRTDHDRATRRIALTLQWLAAFLAASIAVFTTSRMAQDLGLRIRMQQEVSSLNSKLEYKVVKRTAELARAQEQLRDSLADSRDYASEIEAVNEMAKLLQSCLTVEEAREQASSVLQKFFPAGSVLLLNSSRNLLEVALHWGTSPAAKGPFTPESCWGLRTGQDHLSGPHCRRPLCMHSENSPAGCHLCIPMIAQGDALGVLSIEDPNFCGQHPKSRRYERRLKLAHTLAEQISLALANLMLRETLKYQSVRDPLTGLFNRRHMEEVLDRELVRAKRTERPVCLLMIDIDNFKRFNDSYGHEAGDLLLRELGTTLKAQVRGGDFACRYGGEEFLLIMMETDREAATDRAEELRRQVAALQVPYRGEMLRQVTVSIGIAGFPANGEKAEQIVRAADGALYRAKREGRDRVVAAG